MRHFTRDYLPRCYSRRRAPLAAAFLSRFLRQRHAAARFRFQSSFAAAARCRHYFRCLAAVSLADGAFACRQAAAPSFFSYAITLLCRLRLRRRCATMLHAQCYIVRHALRYRLPPRRSFLYALMYSFA